MKMRIAQLLVVLTVLLLSSAGIARAQEEKAGAAPEPQLILTIPAYADGTQVPMPFSCAAKPDEKGDLHGKVNPAVNWSNAPKGTASFAIIFHDIDGTGAPKNGYIDSMHWLVWNIPGNSKGLAEGIPANPELPDGTRQGTNINRRTGYQGACGGPGGKAHHYVMMLYALDQMLDLKGGASAADLVKAIDGHVLGKASVVGLHGK